MTSEQLPPAGRAYVQQAGEAAAAAVRIELSVPERLVVGTPWICPRCGRSWEGTPSPVSDAMLGRPICDCTEAARAAAEEKALQEAWLGAARSIWSQAGLPPIYEGYSFEGFERIKGTERAVQKCREFAGTFGPGQRLGLLIFGTPGNGKTRLAVSTARMIVGRTLTAVRYEAIDELMSTGRPAGNRFSWDHAREEEAKRAPLLILDDIGQDDSAQARQMVYSIIDFRYRQGLPLIATTNGGQPELEQRLGAAAVSRLIEITTPVPNTAPDYRPRLARQRAAGAAAPVRDVA